MINYRQKNVILSKTTKLSLRTRFEGKTVINDKVNFADSMIGFGTYLAPNSILSLTKIGRYCSIAENVKLIVGKHPTKNMYLHILQFFSFKKQSVFSYVKEEKFEEIEYTTDNYILEIGNDVCIGDGVKIFQGVEKGSCAIIDAGAVLTKTIKPYIINAGIPARVIKKRFNDDIIKLLMDFKWWNKQETWIIDNAHLFDDIERFLA
jgi:acetyltransferase-like isoleucine patch superfamily enzyme